jgi:hypothetical protein
LGSRFSIPNKFRVSGESHVIPSSLSARRLHPIRISCGSFESTGKTIASLCEGDRRDSKVVKIVAASRAAVGNDEKLR